MRFLIAITALAFTLLAAQQAFATPDAAGTGKLCLSLKDFATTYDIEVFIPEPKYDSSRAGKSLGDKKRTAQWIRANSLEELYAPADFVTNGTTQSGWQLSASAYIVPTRVDEFGGYRCPHIAEVTYHILMETEIAIASEFPPGTCEYDYIHEHEYKHYLVNKYVVEQAAERLRRDLPKIVRDLEAEGYVGRSKFNERADIIKEALNDVVKIYVRDQIRKEMRELNAKVDTPSEYATVSALMDLCKVKAKQRRARRAASKNPPSAAK